MMLSKSSGKAEYAILSFGGFLGIGQKYHPLPWSQFQYDMSLSNYVVKLDRAQLQRAPTYGADELSIFDERRRGHVDAYYQSGVRPGLSSDDIVNPGVTTPPLPR